MAIVVSAKQLGRLGRIVATIALGAVTLSSCSSSNFAGTSSKSPTPEKPSPQPSLDAKKPAPKSTAQTPDASQGSNPELPLECRKDYQVPASANLWLAGVAAGTRIIYRVPTGNSQIYTSVDAAPGQSPVLVATAGQGCLVAGQALSFTANGQISHGSDPGTDADGSRTDMASHFNGGVYGKSDLRAPINSLIGVFLGADDPTSLPSLAGLDFSSEDARKLPLLTPAVGQVFYIGTGKTAAGEFRKIVVPSGTERLYFGVMDAYEWNNNSGNLTGAIQSSVVLSSP